MTEKIVGFKVVSMRSILYVSHASVLFDEAKDLQRILNSARRHNIMNKVTGCLVYHDRNFLQLIEGPDQAVRDTFARIKKDWRHNGVILMAEDEIEERTFSDWSMGLVSALDQVDDSPCAHLLSDILDGMTTNSLVPSREMFQVLATCFCGRRAFIPNPMDRPAAARAHM